jgi:hypothetical protein
MTPGEAGRVNPLGRYSPEGTDTHANLHRVRLVGVPVALWTKSAEHHDALMREFTLLALDDNAPELPRRLTQLIHDLRAAYGGNEGRDERHRADAVEKGLATIDLEYEVPAGVKDAAVRLTELLDQVDVYCANDSLLLTLASPPEQVAFRHWYVDEFVRQIDGGQPQRWDGPLE